MVTFYHTVHIFIFVIYGTIECLREVTPCFRRIPFSMNWTQNFLLIFKKSVSFIPGSLVPFNIQIPFVYNLTNEELLDVYRELMTLYRFSSPLLYRVVVKSSPH